MTAESPLLVVDASIAVKWFITDGEDGVVAADDLLEQHIQGVIRLAAPALLVHEVLNVLRRPGRVSPALSDAIRALFGVDLMLVSPDEALMVRAAELVAERGLSTFDAAYVALAEALKCELVTADRRLARAVGESVAVRIL
jgi:predicted nucleic acid-binding protein